MRTFEDGALTFGGSGTNYDYYCLKNTLTTKNKTKINDIDRNKIELDLNKLNYIPNGKFKEFLNLSTNSNQVNLIAGSLYHTQRPYVKKTFTEEFKYKLVYTITQGKGIKCLYTNEKKGMFVPKVIWSNGAGTYPVIDIKGEYGLTEFSYGINDDSESLKFIKNAMNDPKFIDLMKYVQFGTAHKYNKKIIGTFKKDFWKEFDYKNEHKSSNNKTKKNNKKPESKQKSNLHPKPKKTKKKKKKLVIINNKNK